MTSPYTTDLTANEIKAWLNKNNIYDYLIKGSGRHRYVDLQQSAYLSLDRQGLPFKINYTPSSLHIKGPLTSESAANLPSAINGLMLSNNSLTSLEFLKNIEIKNGFYCEKNNLENLKGLPPRIEGDLSFKDCGLQSLEGISEYVAGMLILSHNQLKHLDFLPTYIGKTLDIGHNQLKSLNGLPRHINGALYLSGNQLTSLIGCPEHIEEDFHASFNPLTSLEGFPLYVGKQAHLLNTRITDISHFSSYNKGITELRISHISNKKVEAFSSFYKNDCLTLKDDDLNIIREQQSLKESLSTIPLHPIQSSVKSKAHKI